MPSKDDTKQQVRGDGVKSPGSSTGKRKKKVLVKKKKSPSKTHISDTSDPIRTKVSKTEPVRTVVSHPGGGEYYVEESDDSQAAAGPSYGSQKDSSGQYFVTQQPSSDEGESYYYPSEPQSYQFGGDQRGGYEYGGGGGGGVEIVSVADDEESIYTDATEVHRVSIHHFEQHVSSSVRRFEISIMLFLLHCKFEVVFYILFT
uniref:uncharacterized protein LOC120341951 isoform X2 n=1 Tax=Styela clava TaxID=7725 RepID=UPI001939A38E|nr:uncharacterized protein LOC120341951 isoform X2 [Styela clava]